MAITQNIRCKRLSYVLLKFFELKPAATWEPFNIGFLLKWSCCTIKAG